MRRRLFLMAGSLAGACLVLTCNWIPVQAQSPALIISAAASLKDALEQIQLLYQDSQGKITFNFGSSGSLQQQIEQGAPVDIFIAAAARQMNALEEKGLILTETRTDLVKNELVLITPKQGSLISGIQELLQPTIKKIALGEPDSVPAGSYAQQAFEALGVWDTLKPKVVYGKNVRQVLSYVEAGEVDAGIVYQTDAKLSNQVKVVIVFDPSTHQPIVYPMAILKESKNPEAAKAFTEFLQGKEAQDVFETFGFKIL